MSFEWFMIAFGWLAAAIFAGVSAYRIGKIARLPLNVRWEVYPVPHEAPDKRGYGGSYMEQVDWAAKPRTSSPLPGYVEMATEILTLKKVRENNPYHLWPFSLAMHWGIYLYFAWLFLLVVENLIAVPAIAYLTTTIGVAAFGLGTFGCAALAVRRATDHNLRLYTTPLDYFNLVFLGAIFVSGLASWLPGLSFAGHKAYVGSVLAFKPTDVPFPVALCFLLFELFMIYMPFTKLIHYFAKYLTFDLTLWGDEFHVKGSAADEQIARQLGYGVTWSAPHIAPGKTWLEQAQAASEGDKE